MKHGACCALLFALSLSQAAADVIYSWDANSLPAHELASGAFNAASNSPPYILAEIPAQQVSVGQTPGPLSFLVFDAEDPAASLKVTASSSNPAIISSQDIVVTGTSAERSLTIQKLLVPGTATVTIEVRDTGGRSATYSFTVTVLPADRPPVLECPPPVYVRMNESSKPFVFAAYDPDPRPRRLEIVAQPWDTTLIPASGLQLSTVGTNCLLVITPAPGRAGTTLIELEASDGVNVTQCTLPCVVLPSADTLLYDSFHYPDGSLTEESGQLWFHRSGSVPDFLVQGGLLRLSAERTEDVEIMLHKGPYDPGSNTAVYVSFKLQVPHMPIRPAPDYIAHLVSGNSLVSRLYIGTNNAVEKTYRLSLTNVIQGGFTTFPMSMNRNVLYLVVTRYDVDSGATRLWVNPQSETSPSVLVTDTQSPGRISSFGLRQSTGIGDELLIDELKIGRTFASVTSGAAVVPLLRWARQNQSMSFSWDDPQCRLQAGGTPSGPFTNVPGAISPYVWQITPEKRAFFRLNQPN